MLSPYGKIVFKRNSKKSIPPEIVDDVRKHSFIKPQQQSNGVARKGGNEEKIDKLIQNSETILLKIKAFWPFDLFPNEVTIDLNKVTIYFKEFFYSGDNRSILMKNIADVSVQTGLVFATLSISSIYDRNEGKTGPQFQSNVVKVGYLKRDEAILAKRIINGLIVAIKEDIDLTRIEKGNLKQRIEELGQSLEGKS